MSSSTGGGLSVGDSGLAETASGAAIVGERVIEITWRERTIAEKEIEGRYVMQGTIADLIDGSGKPALIYFYSSATPEEKRLASEKKMFGRFEAVLASRMFQCLRVDVESIKSRQQRAELAPHVPMLYILSSKGDVIAKKPGGLAAKALTQALHDAYHTEFEECIGARLRNLADNLRKQTTLHSEMAQTRIQLSKQMFKNEGEQTPAARQKVTAIETTIEGIQDQLRDLRDAKSRFGEPPAAKASVEEKAAKQG